MFTYINSKFVYVEKYVRKQISPLPGYTNTKMHRRKENNGKCLKPSDHATR